MGRIKDMGFGVGDYFTPAKINRKVMSGLFKSVDDSVKLKAKALIEIGWRFYAVDQSRGRCYYRERVITIPTWVCCAPVTIDKRIWYIAHEMAHAYLHISGKANDYHGPNFMSQLIDICPDRCLHHELGYKPRNAAKAGIQKPENKVINELGF